MEFQNKTVIISGGASGLGFLSGLCFAKEGANVVLTDVNPKALEEKVEEIRENGGKCIGVVTDVRDYAQVTEACRQAVTPFEATRAEAVRARIREGIAKLGVEVDENRLEQEMIFYIEKLDITEEKVRLANHCNYFREVAATEPMAGRKLGFIAQEMGREINTTGSKANNHDIQVLVVKMKDELEKIKEQVLNIL